VLGAVKVKPSRARKVRDLDRPCARRRVDCAGRDGRMGSAGAEQKDDVRRKTSRKKAAPQPTGAALWLDGPHRPRPAT
jgi:hypothetical protein